MGKVMNVFYRYLRPIRFDSKRLEFVTLPNGGICLRFEEDLDGTLWFTHARCHPDDHFNKRVAKQIADWRAAQVKYDPMRKAACGGLKYAQDTTELAHAVANHCENWTPPNASHEPVGIYLKMEWKGLAEAIDRMGDANWAQYQMCDIWLSSAHALHLTEFYGNKTAT